MGGSCICLLGLTIAEVKSLGFSVSFLRFLLVGCVMVSNFLFFSFTSSSWSLRTLSSVLSNISRCDSFSSEVADVWRVAMVLPKRVFFWVNWWITPL